MDVASSIRLQVGLDLTVHRCKACETLADGRKSGPPIALRDVDQAQLNPGYDVLKRSCPPTLPHDSVLNHSTQPIAT